MRRVRTALWAGAIAALLAAEPAASSRKLDARQQAQWQQLDELLKTALRDGAFDQAVQAAREIASLRQRGQGETHWQSIDARLAQERYESLLRVPAKDRPQLARSFRLEAEGEALKERQQYALADKPYRQALAIRCLALGEEHALTAQSYNALAANLNNQGKYAAAQPFFEKALAIRRKVLGEEHPDTAASYYNLAYDLKDQDHYAQARPLFEKALAIRRKVLGEGHPSTAWSYDSLAANLNAQGKHAAAEPLFEKALRIRLQVLGEEHRDTATSYNNLAYCLGCQGGYVEAQPLYEHALAIWRKVLGEQHADTATCYNNLAYNLNAQGQYAAAQPLQERALAIWRKVLGEEHPLTGNGYNNLAVNLNSQGRYTEALPLLEKATRIYSQVLGADHADLAFAYAGQANCLESQGEYTQAQTLLEKALALRSKALGPEHLLTAYSYTGLALNLQAQGKHDQAQPLFEKALALRRKALGEQHPDTAAGYNNLAFSLYRQGQYAQAQPLFEKALGVLRSVLGTEHSFTATISNNLALDLWRQHKLPEAVALLEASLSGQEVARFQRAGSGFNRVLAATQESPHLLLAVAQACQKQPTEAFRHAEACLARGLLDDLMARSETDARQAVALRTRLAQLDRQLRPLLNRTSLAADSEALRQDLVRQRRDTLRRLAHLAADSSARQVQSVAEIQKQLPDDTALVLWLDIDGLGEHHAGILRHRGDPVWMSLPGSGAGGAWTERDRELADRLYHSLEKPHPSQSPWQRLAADLYQQRLAPLRIHLQAADGLPAVRHLLVVPSGWAGLVPLEVLGTEYRISYVPSGSVYARLRHQHRAVCGNSLLALGDPVFTAGTASRSDSSPITRGPDPDPLPGTRWEVLSLARLVPQSTTLLGSDASEQRLDELVHGGRLQNFRLIHLATHGIVDWQTPARSRLLLARDRLPDASEVAPGHQPYTGELTVDAIRAGWRLDADLVVLSACRTALGRKSYGDGFLGFAQAFLQCGAHSVVLSRWAADDTATALLMVRFYENLLGTRQGMRKPLGRAAALAEARRWLREMPRSEAESLAAALRAGRLQGTTRGSVVELNIRERPVKLPAGDQPYAHPFYWAGFVLVGDPD